MNISKWTLEKVMQLPDFCFGERWPVSCTVDAAGEQTVWDISECGLPERFVLWELDIMWILLTSTTAYIRIAIGNKIPVSVATMSCLQPLITGMGRTGPEPRQIQGQRYMAFERIVMRKPIIATGKRLVAEAVSVPTGNTEARITIVVSSIPKEVPDWLFSGLAGVRM